MSLTRILVKDLTMKNIADDLAAEWVHVTRVSGCKTEGAPLAVYRNS